MKALLKILYSLCWSNAYLIMGTCMGLSFSLLLIPIDVDRQHDVAESFDHSSNTLEDIDPYEPRINRQQAATGTESEESVCTPEILAIATATRLPTKLYLCAYCARGFRVHESRKFELFKIDET
jgi:hypothetical protein